MTIDPDVLKTSLSIHQVESSLMQAHLPALLRSSLSWTDRFNRRKRLVRGLGQRTWSEADSSFLSWLHRSAGGRIDQEEQKYTGGIKLIVVTVEE